MGCSYAKTLEYEQKPKRGRLRALFGRDHRRTKVQSIHIGDPVGVAVNEGTPMINLRRKTEQTVLMQLRQEGIIPNTGSGGVAFTVKLNDEPLQKLTSNEDFHQMPGVPQYTWRNTKTVTSKPRLLPPLTTKSVSKLPPQKREAKAEYSKNEALRRKGKMARLSDNRRELAAAKREAKQKQKREHLEAKMMKTTIQENGEIDHKVNVNDRIEQARLKRDSKAAEKRSRVNEKLARIPRTEKPTKISTDERLERARQNREKRLEGMREKLDRKEKRIEEIKKSRRLNTPAASVPKIEM
ncbi:stress response protein NST1-like [Pecten maximus]|uniref:stress response protein NST1-like n=1 Tax=Pecten maximus TaxID=6579 RepID=UPI001458E544|nr:stress response protein NST1-like [Pecten maximus]